MPDTLFFILLLVCFAIGHAGTGAIIPLLNRKNVMDIPNQRSNHKTPVPRGGGIVITVAILLSLAFLNYSFTSPLALGIAALAIISLVDDIRGLSIQWRLLVHVITVFTVLITGKTLGLTFHGLLPVWADTLITGLLWVGFINLYNFMDGIDGITGSETISICMGIVLLASLLELPDPTYLYAPVLIAIMLGFLKHNWHPAKIFMGDVGSVPLGFFVGYLLLFLISQGYWVSALIFPAYYLADGGLTLLNRIRKRERFWEPHSQHFYQQAVRAGKRHSTVVLMILAGNTVLITSGVIAALKPDYALAMIGIAGISVLLLLYALKRK